MVALAVEGVVAPCIVGFDAPVVGEVVGIKDRMVELAEHGVGEGGAG